MSRRMDAPDGFECPYRHNCPYMDGRSTTWANEVFEDEARHWAEHQEMEQRLQERIDELEKTLLERDATIAALRLQHQKQFKSKTKPAPIKARSRRRGAPVGHPGWSRREPDHIDRVVHVPAPTECPHCQSKDLTPCAKKHVHLQEDIVLVPKTQVTQYVHDQADCPICRREVYQTGEGEMRGCHIGPVTRAVATHLRYNLQIPYRKVRHIFADLFGMPMVPATAMNFDRLATVKGRPLHQELGVMLKSSDVANADETTWREDGKLHYIWYGGNKDLAVYQITDNRAAESAVLLLGENFGGALTTDDYAAYNAVGAENRQTCWNHIRTRAKEITQQIGMTDPPVEAPRSLKFCKGLRRFAAKMCLIGRKQRAGKLKLDQTKKMIPAFRKELSAIGKHPLDHETAETLRNRVMEKDKDKLFTFLRVAGVEPTNNQSERSLRFLVIMRKICFGTRSAAGTESHEVLASLLQTAQRQGKSAIGFIMTLLTKPLEAARAALFRGSASST